MPIGALLVFTAINVVAVVAPVIYWRRRRRDASRSTQLEQLTTVTAAPGLLVLLDLGVLLEQQWALVVGLAILVVAALLLLSAKVLAWWELREERQLRAAMGVPVGRGLWHPGIITALYVAGFVPAINGALHALDWYIERSPRQAASAWSDRDTSVAAALILGGYLVLATGHVIVQAVRRRRDHRRVQQATLDIADDPALAPPGPFLVPDGALPHLRRLGAQWRAALARPHPTPLPGSVEGEDGMPMLSVLVIGAALSAGMWGVFTYAFVAGAAAEPVTGTLMMVVWFVLSAVAVAAGGPYVVYAYRQARLR